jgi:sugar lactone lactonase YvrE
MAIIDFRLDSADLHIRPAKLRRPECILATRDGTLHISDGRGGITRLSPDGNQTMVGTNAGTPNGFILAKDGSYLSADIDSGRFVRIASDGSCSDELDQYNGQDIGAPNFVFHDRQDRLWLTISTRTKPRRLAVDNEIPDGFILQKIDGEFRCVADKLCFVNEVRVDRDGHYLYAAETARSRIVRWPIRDDGTLGTLEVFGPERLFPGALIDGLAFDVEGNLWFTDVRRNGIYILTPERVCIQVFEDPEGKRLQFPASLAFSGPDLRTVVIGSIEMSHLITFRSPIAGEPLMHWDY